MIKQFKNQLHRSISQSRSKKIYIGLAAALLLVCCLFSISFAMSGPGVLAKIEGRSSTSTASINSVQLVAGNLQFDLQILYVYVGNGPDKAPHSHFGTAMYPRSQYPSMVYFNVTYIGQPTSTDKAKIEVYLVEILSDKGSFERYAFIEGINYEPSFCDEQTLKQATAHIDDLIDAQSVLTSSGFLSCNLTANQSIYGNWVGSLESYTSKPSSLGLWTAGIPDSITVSVSRIGWIVINSEKSITTLQDTSPQIISEVQLDKHGDGFLYNAVSLQELSQKDLFRPNSPWLMPQMQP